MVVQGEITAYFWNNEALKIRDFSSVELPKIRCFQMCTAKTGMNKIFRIHTVPWHFSTVTGTNCKNNPG
jgi:hypothetical protein